MHPASPNPTGVLPPSGLTSAANTELRQTLSRVRWRQISSLNTCGACFATTRVSSPTKPGRYFSRCALLFWAYASGAGRANDEYDRPPQPKACRRLEKATGDAGQIFDVVTHVRILCMLFRRRLFAGLHLSPIWLPRCGARRICVHSSFSRMVVCGVFLAPLSCNLAVLHSMNHLLALPLWLVWTRCEMRQFRRYVASAQPFWFWVVR